MNVGQSRFNELVAAFKSRYRHEIREGEEYYLAILLVTHILIALFALGFAQYAVALVPDLDIRVIAIGILALFYVVNLVGVKPAAAVQKVMIVFLLIALVALGQQAPTSSDPLVEQTTVTTLTQLTP